MASQATGARQDVLVSDLDVPRPPVDSKIDSLTVSTTGSSASAAFARSLFLFLGIMFRRPSKLFRPSRVDTWGGLRQLALSADQTLSATFIRDLLKRKSGVVALTLTIIPPLAINTTLGFLLFTSHSMFALSLAKLPFFQHKHPGEDSRLVDHEGSMTTGASQQQQGLDEEITLETLLTGPHIIPRHPTLLSAIAGGGAGLVQGLAFTPMENLVRLLSQSASSITSLFARFLNLPSPRTHSANPAKPVVSSPVQALRNFLSSETWVKSPGWWSGWRWTVARDALSYGVFFASFDVTRRCGLRVKAFFGGRSDPEWHTNISISNPSEPATTTPTRARVAQATTIVAGGVTASILAELAGRPFRTCQRLMTEHPASTTPAFMTRGNPVFEVYKAHGIRPFFRKGGSLTPDHTKMDRGFGRMMKRFGWRLAAVGPWGAGFLVWAWVGGEV